MIKEVYDGGKGARYLGGTGNVHIRKKEKVAKGRAVEVEIQVTPSSRPTQKLVLPGGSKAGNKGQEEMKAIGQSYGDSPWGH